MISYVEMCFTGDIVRIARLTGSLVVVVHIPTGVMCQSVIAESSASIGRKRRRFRQ